MLLAFFLLVSGFFPFHAASGAELSEQMLADLAKPSVVRIGLHVQGEARIPAIKVDLKNRLMAVVPGSLTTVSVDEYLSGSGFIIHPDGYIATNAHVASAETVKLDLASESALKGLFQAALSLSEEEMEAFLASPSGEAFARQVLGFVIEESTFDFAAELAVLKPGSPKAKLDRLIGDGYPAEVVSINTGFIDDERDVAILKIAASNLPALHLGVSRGLSAGARIFTFGFPGTATLNENDPTIATFTSGTVSAEKSSEDRSFTLFQTDAKVSQGSSGGPLFDALGQAVGMVTFQTSALESDSGDNFAFALPIELVKEAAFEARVPFVEGEYGQNLRQGLVLLSEQRCAKALPFFRLAAERTNAAFLVPTAIDGYVRECRALQASGASLDSLWDEASNSLGSLGHPLLWLSGGGVLLLVLFGGTLVWLFRKVKREEQEIEILEERLEQDERELHLGEADKTDTRPR